MSPMVAKGKRKLETKRVEGSANALIEKINANTTVKARWDQIGI